ncbi:ATP-binding cassette domain-containing protein [Neorhizobium galegae]|uniref:ATP-binding cassette domain-containing protein n=1 Tax=Neorhizobium galegae TaxID=399 RepID=UPI0026774597|nr:ATP-binding cassette domain-containing protein [Neorhizobium galegae]
MHIETSNRALVVTDVHKSYGAHEVLKGISLSAEKGDVVSIIGSSGSGKSTFLRCINFLEIPDRGTFQINGVGFHAELSRFFHRELSHL